MPPTDGLYLGSTFYLFSRPRPPRLAIAMGTTILDQIICRRCHAVLDSADNFCRHCGAPTTDGPHASAAPSPSPPAPNRSLQDSPWVMLGLLFLAMGPLALPMLWRGRAFGRRGKIAVTLLVVALTVAMVWICYLLVVSLIIVPLQKVFIL